MKNKEEVLTHLFNAYHELVFAEEELCHNDDECLDEIIQRAKDKTSDAILMIKALRIKEKQNQHLRLRRNLGGDFGDNND